MLEGVSVKGNLVIFKAEGINLDDCMEKLADVIIDYSKHREANGFPSPEFSDLKHNYIRKNSIWNMSLVARV